MKHFLSLSFLVTITMSLFSQNTVHFNLTTDNYPEETSWELEDEGGTTVASGDNYTGDEVVQATETVSGLADGIYTFAIYDTAGDGICCGYGVGEYTLTEDGTGLIIAEGATFGDEESTTFVLPYVPPVEGCTDPDALNYNPDALVDDGSCISLISDPVVDLELVASDFNSPVDISSAGDERLFIVEQGGVIQILNDDFTTNSEPFLDISSETNGGGEQGLLGLAFHPNYPDSGYFYVNYTKNNGDSRISRFSVTSDPDIADPNSELVILEQDQPYSNHNAGDLNFGPDGYLYIPFGDGGSGGDPQGNGQNHQTWLGKMLRIDIDNGNPYSIPLDNPYAEDDFTLDEIWAIGLRNTWRFSFDALTGDMWMADVGQNQWEEIDFQEEGFAGGANYGWRCYEGNNDYDTDDCGPMDDYDAPVFEFPHSSGACSVTGGYVYRGDEFPSLYGGFIFTDYCNGLFMMLFPDGDEWQNFDVTDFEGFGWSTFGEATDLNLYVANLDGNIYRITSPCDALTAEITVDGLDLIAPTADSYVWLLDGELIEGATGQTYTPTELGFYSVGISTGGCSVISEEVEVTVISVNELTLNTDIKIYPNPASENITISLPNELSDGFTIQIIDTKGSIVEELSSLNKNGRELSIPVSSLATGIYTLKMSDGTGLSTGRFSVVD